MLHAPAGAYLGRVRARDAGNTIMGYGWTGVLCSYALGYQSVRRDPVALERHSRTWARVLVRTLNVEVDVKDPDRVPTDRRVVLMANHQSHADAPALFVALPVLPVFLAKKELRRVPLFGRLMETGGHVFIDRGKHDSAVSTIDDAAASLRPGHPLLVFPEGTRARGSEIARFKKGGFHLARKARVPIIPIGIRGSREVWPRGQAYAVPGLITVHIGEPISADEVASEPLEALMDRVRTEISELSATPLAAR